MRLVATPHFHVSYRELVEYWDLDEVLAAHEIVDIREELEAEASKA